MKAAIIGSVGVPGKYGGFETLAENLVAYHQAAAADLDLAVYCSSKAFEKRLDQYRAASLRYVNLDANGIQSIPYDVWGLIDAVLNGRKRLLLLGVSGAIALPFLRLVPGIKIITNVDGIEWKREKWRGLARFYLHFSEWVAVRVSHKVIADNQAIADYIKDAYGCDAEMIPYGGDHVFDHEPDDSELDSLPRSYALGLCRIEPENNVDMILEAFSSLEVPLVFVGNWDRSEYGRALKAKYAGHPKIIIHGPVYEPGRLRAIRNRANLYMHGHSAGGTNPALVEMMHFGLPILAHGCEFNRQTTEGKALYFDKVSDIRSAIEQVSPATKSRIGDDMREIAQRRYTWNRIAKSYFALLEA